MLKPNADFFLILSVFNPVKFITLMCVSQPSSSPHTLHCRFLALSLGLTCFLLPKSILPTTVTLMLCLLLKSGVASKRLQVYYCQKYLTSWITFSNFSAHSYGMAEKYKGSRNTWYLVNEKNIRSNTISILKALTTRIRNSFFLNSVVVWIIKCPKLILFSFPTLIAKISEGSHHCLWMILRFFRLLGFCDFWLELRWSALV